MELRVASGESIDPFEFRNRFPAQGGAIQSAFSRLRGFRDQVTRTEHLQVTRISDPALGPGASDPFPKESLGFDVDEDERPSEEIPEQLGVFKIGKKLGSGGFGIVHLAEDTSTGQQLALKFPRRQQIRTSEEFEMFRCEADAASGLNHPGIVRTYGVFEEDGYIFIAQQLVVGGSLTSFRDGAVSQRRIAEIVASISDALAYAHQQGITHRDLKPSNIMLDQDGNPLIADFGLAIHDSAQRRLKGQRSGTPHYMSPEQVNGLAHMLDGRSDIWSLGVIMYELLVGRRPFDGQFRDELFEEITERDPKPLRMIRPQVDRELQRICLKCLYKPIRERYDTADDLSQDLHCWLDGRSAESPGRSAIPVVPKGLRSFGAHDSDFYQRLLPGPKDQLGLAEVTRFWKSQIETPQGQQGFRMGVIIGPSGCGKSSYIKAGLLPFLDPNRVESIFVEATSQDTETRLLQGLYMQFPDFPARIALPQLVDLTREELRGGDKKLLIVIDQFEQWLHAQPSFEKTELLQALLHVDGDHLQCILLVRDDFWLRISQFLHAMEIDFREGTNARRIDLFEKRHAKQVLHEFGFAFDKLPDLDQELTADQAAFLEQAIESIAEEERVVCVRLALFAEMFRNRPWTVAELEKVGGAAGIGETFLNETFASADADLFYRRNEQPVRRILAGLLPSTGEKIRAHMRTHEYLLSRSGLPRAEFDELMNRLDEELRLVTPTDPNASGESDNLEESETSRHFQLTHDYLVPSIRDWLTREKKRTKRGRAELRLNELSGYWNQKRDPSFLPSWQEFASIRWRVSRSSWTPRQLQFMRKASQIFLVRGALILLVVGILTGLGYVWNYRFQAAAMHDELLSASITQVPEIVEKMKPIRRWIEPRLAATQDEIESREGFQTATGASREDRERLLRLNLVRVGLADGDADARHVETLKQFLLEAPPGQLGVIRQTLLPHDEQVVDALWNEVDKPDGRVLQAAAGLALFDAGNSRWKQSGPAVANRLVNVSSAHFPVWLSMFEPVRETLLPLLVEIHADPGRSATEKRLALDLIIQYQNDGSEYLVEAIEHADKNGFDAIVAELRDKNPMNLLENSLQISARPRWSDELATQSPPRLPPEVEDYFGAAHGQVHPAFAWCASMPRDVFRDACSTLKPLGYRPGCVRIADATTDPQQISCVWVRDGLDFKTRFGNVAEITAHHGEMESAGYQAVDIGCFAPDQNAAVARNTTTKPEAVYCITWRKTGDIPATHLELELTDDEWTSLADSIALTGFRRLERRCAVNVDGGRLLSGIWSKSDSATTTFDALNPKDPSFVGQLQLDQRADGAEVWAESAQMESATVQDQELSSHSTEATRLIKAGFRPHLVTCGRDADGQLSVSSIWHRPRITEAEKERISKIRVNLALAILALQADSPIAWREFRWCPDPRTRSELIHRLREFGFPAKFVFDRLRTEQDVTARRALLLALGEYELTELDSGAETVKEFILSEYKIHHDAGVHSAAAWVLKRWEMDEQLEFANESLKSSREDVMAIRANDQQRWFVSPLNHQMVLIEGGKFLMGSPPNDPEIGEDEELKWKKIDRTFALSVHETTRAQYNKFVQATGAIDMVNRSELRFQAPTMDCPIAGIDWYETAAYCNWLSEQEGIPEAQWCYETNSDGQYSAGMRAKPNFLSLAGYRLPTLAEWEFACRSGAVTSRYFGQSVELLDKYGWYVDNAQRRSWPVGSLKPNDFGLFDMHGNLWEWLEDQTTNYGRFLDESAATGLEIDNGQPARSLRGGGLQDAGYGVRAADRSGMEADSRDTTNTFRVARTIPE